MRDAEPVVPNRDFAIGPSSKQTGVSESHGASSVNVRPGRDFSALSAKSVERAATVLASLTPVRASVPTKVTDLSSSTHSATAKVVPVKTLALTKE